MNATLLKDIAARADRLRAETAGLADGDCAARAACCAVPLAPWRPGLDHVSVWPGALGDFKPMPRREALREAMAYLTLEFERLEKPADAAAA